jgi:hypothetical protein
MSPRSIIVLELNERQTPVLLSNTTWTSIYLSIGLSIGLHETEAN